MPSTEKVVTALLRAVRYDNWNMILASIAWNFFRALWCEYVWLAYDSATVIIIDDNMFSSFKTPVTRVSCRPSERAWARVIRCIRTTLFSIQTNRKWNPWTLKRWVATMRRGAERILRPTARLFYGICIWHIACSMSYQNGKNSKWDNPWRERGGGGKNPFQIHSQYYKILI